MWLSQRRQTELEEAAAELGQVTVPGSPAGVALAGERRDVALCLPGGYHWTPKRGDTVLVVKGGAEGAPCIVGTPAGQKVPAGEVFLSVKNGVGVRLTADGRICLVGPVEIAGSLSVNGRGGLGTGVLSADGPAGEIPAAAGGGEPALSDLSGEALGAGRIGGQLRGGGIGRGAGLTGARGGLGGGVADLDGLRGLGRRASGRDPGRQRPCDRDLSREEEGARA